MKFINYISILMILFISIACETRKEIPLVRIGHAPHDHHAPLYIAAVKQKYFNSKSGVYLKEVDYKKSYQLFKNDKLIANVQIDSGTGGINLIRKLDEKIIDLSFGGVPAMIDMIDTGSKIKIVAPVMSEGAALVVGNDIPVSDWDSFIEYVRNTADPVRIGYKVDKSVQNIIFETALKSEHLSYSRSLSAINVDVVVVNLHGPKNIIPALNAKIIDGFVVMQPYPALAEYRGVGKIIAHLRTLPPSHKWEDHPCCALAAGDDFINNESEVLEALIELFRYASTFIIENPAESAEIVSAWLGTPKDVELTSIPSIKYLNEFSGDWDDGVDFWIKSLVEKGDLSGRVKDSYLNSNVEKVLYDKSIYNKINQRLADNANK